MQFNATTPADARKGRDPLVLFVFEGDKEPEGFKDLMAQAARRDRFKGAADSAAKVWDARERAVVFAGLGRRKELTEEGLRSASARAVRELRQAGPRVTLLLPGALAPAAEAHAAATGAALGLYEFDRYKTRKNPTTVKTVVLAAKSADRVKEALPRAAAYVRATMRSRDLVNEPAMVMTPRRLAEEARETARRSGGRLKIRVFDEKEIERRKMVGLRGVSLGSDQPPRFVHLSYRAPGARKTVALVGKGITFDSGGLDIKPASGMANMKDDMSGAAAVICVMEAVAALRPRVNVHGIFGATENLLGGRAYKPGDVLTYRNGVSVEITNTDAEGRVILADALLYACDQKPDVLIDMATLTGACVMALGERIAALFTADDTLSRELIRAGRAEGEMLWRMPLHAPYFEMIKSKVAHMVNSGGRGAGAITAALFLKEFVAKDVKWAHLDIAGPAFAESAWPYAGPGATGFIVRTLLNYLEA